MWLPWRNKTGLAKAAVILTTILSIATVSCGLNVVLVTTSMDSKWALGDMLLFTAYAELGAMIASVAGLLVVLVIWLAAKGRAAMRKDSDD
jgi:phosphate starvation-inducible membrane PsiE